MAIDLVNEPKEAHSRTVSSSGRNRHLLGPRALFLHGLQNPGTSCYANSVASMLTWLMLVSPDVMQTASDAMLGALTPLLERHYGAARVPIDLLNLVGWHSLLLGWNIGRQEDVSEFLSHILVRAPLPSTVGTMHLQPSGFAPQHQEFLILNVPVPCNGSKGALDINLLFDLWSRSGEASAPRDCLLVHAPQALFICLLRFRYGDSVEKVRTAIALPDYVDIPLMGSEGVVTFATYRCAALILHHGDSPYHGHYTALLCHLPSTASSSIAGHWLLDDARIPRAVSSSEASKLSASDMYMLCLVKRDRGVRS